MSLKPKSLNLSENDNETPAESGSDKSDNPDETSDSGSEDSDDQKSRKEICAERDDLQEVVSRLLLAAKRKGSQPSADERLLRVEVTKACLQYFEKNGSVAGLSVERKNMRASLMRVFQSAMISRRGVVDEQNRSILQEQLTKKVSRVIDELIAECMASNERGGVFFTTNSGGLEQFKLPSDLVKMEKTLRSVVADGKEETGDDDGILSVMQNIMGREEAQRLQDEREEDSERGETEEKYRWITACSPQTRDNAYNEIDGSLITPATLFKKDSNGRCSNIVGGLCTQTEMIARVTSLFNSMMREKSQTYLGMEIMVLMMAWVEAMSEMLNGKYTGTQLLGNFEARGTAKKKMADLVELVVTQLENRKSYSNLGVGDSQGTLSQLVHVSGMAELLSFISMGEDDLRRLMGVVVSKIGSAAQQQQFLQLEEAEQANPVRIVAIAVQNLNSAKQKGVFMDKEKEHTKELCVAFAAKCWKSLLVEKQKQPSAKELADKKTAKENAEKKKESSKGNQKQPGNPKSTAYGAFAPDKKSTATRVMHYNSNKSISLVEVDKDDIITGPEIHSTLVGEKVCRFAQEGSNKKQSVPHAKKPVKIVGQKAAMGAAAVTGGTQSASALEGASEIVLNNPELLAKILSQLAQKSE